MHLLPAFVHMPLPNHPSSRYYASNSTWDGWESWNGTDGMQKTVVPVLLQNEVEVVLIIHERIVLVARAVSTS